MVLASAGCDFFAPSGPGGDGRRSAVSGLLGTPLPGTNPLASPSPTATPGGGGAGAGPVVKTQELTIVQGQVRAGLGGTNPLADATPLAALPEITDVPALPP
ncbi:MAG: hypothetical protein FJZ00_06930, partial [Candidatus Sericytochromatia bacterium]|nr:hypothetical protein [Candidatus Tanganyikabacteria bacterium]